MASRKQKLVRNTFSSMFFQIITILCGFILPKLILKTYGSKTNGLVSSIQQFLQVIAFLELGIGAVVKSALYKPLAENDNTKISAILASANRFFKKLAGILLVYVILLLIFYPVIVNSTEDRASTMFLIAAMSVSYFAQYYFGIVNQLLLISDQRGYIQYNIQTATLVGNTLICSAMILGGSSIQMVKLASSMIFLLRPILYKAYVDRHYHIDKNVVYSGEPISQKWNGVAQHVAAIVLDSTDIIVLTIWSSLENISVYYVYHMVVFGVKKLFLSMTNGIQALLGELWAKQEMDTLSDFFGWVEWCIHTGTVFVFACTGVLILPFVQVYTNHITDAQYLVPSFAACITLAHAVHCLRIPYNNMILAAGHYKQTQSNYIVAAALNLLVSIATVRQFGLIGVALGTLAAMAYQTVWMAAYISRTLICWPFSKFLKQLLTDAISAGGLAVCAGMLPGMKLYEISYLSWVGLALKTALYMLIIIVSVNLVFYPDKIRRVWDGIRRRRPSEKTL